MNREKELFEQALDLDSPQEREAFLQGACRADAAMLERLLGLLRASEGASDFLPEAPQAAATVQLEVPDVRAEAVGQTLGRYQLLERVGEGGCGVVYVAEQIEPVRRRVALKVIKLGMDTNQVVARFEAERQALAMMDHPNIARVLDAGTTDVGRPYFVMELVRGIRITDYCDQNNLPTQDRLDLFMKVCQAIQHAHQKGIIHRDIKPSNILVTLHDGQPVPKVIDFGIAKATEGRLTDATIYTQLHQMIGTPAYMSPEQAEMTGLDIDTRSDIYSLGVLLYELLAGAPPFDPKELMASGIDQMRKTIRDREPVRPSTRLATLQGDELTTTANRRSSDVPRLIHQLKGDLDWIVMKCLEKDRARRYETASGLAADLKRHLANEPVVARPPSAAYRFQKTFRRNKLAFTAAAAVVVALLLGLGISTWQAFVALRAQRDTEAARKGEFQQRLQAQSALKSAEAERQRAEVNAGKATAAALQSRRNEFAADLFAASTQIEKGNFRHARNLLREYFPREGQEELRTFEWRHWWQLSAGQQKKTFVTPAKGLSMASAPDGRSFAIGQSDRAITILDSDTGATKSSLLGHQGPVTSVSFSFDGQGLASSSSEGTVRFWDLKDGSLVYELAHRYPHVACSPTGPLMAIGTDGDNWGQRGGDVLLVDTKSGRTLKVLPKGGDRSVFSPDGRTLATANAGRLGSQSLILWDVETGEKRNALGNMKQVLGMAFSRDGRLLAIGNRRGEVILWNLNDSQQVTLRESTHDYCRGLAFSPDGRWLAAGLQTQEIEVWDLQQRRRIDRLRGHTADIFAVVFSPDGTRLASVSEDATLRLWAPHSSVGETLIPKLKLDLDSWVGNPVFSPDSHLVAVALTDGNVQILDPTTLAWNARAVLTNAGLPVAFSRDAATLLALARDRKAVSRWNIATGERLSTTALKSTNALSRCSAATHDGDRLALADHSRIEIFDTRSGRILDQFKSPVQTRNLEFSKDGLLLAICDWRGSNVVWDIASRSVTQRFVGPREPVSAIRFSPDQKLMATASWDSDVRLWDVATGRELAVLKGHKATALNCIFTPDGRTLITGSDDGTIKFWNVATFRETACISLGVSPGFLAMSPDGKILAANAEYDLRCWRAPSLAEIDAAEAESKQQ